MNATKAMTLLAAAAVGFSAQALTLAVKDVKMAQRYPWNGLVDIDYTVECDDANADVYVYPVGYDVDMNLSIPPRTLTGDGANGKAVKAGKHRMTWDMATDMGANYNRAKFSMKVHAYAGAAPYMVIDLSEGSDAETYGVSYMSEVPEGGWPLEYKTTKMVLKLVTPGTFMMGSPDDELGHNASGMETLHRVTLTQPFYMGVFEVTQKQYELVTGSNPSYYKGDSRPVERVSYNDLRGSTLGAQWPNYQQVDATSFMGKLRARTGITFDLPTEAQWEYTCRAGTSTALNSGKNLTVIGKNYCANLAEVARYSQNRGDGRGGYSEHTEVGSYRPNAWGFYDMHGNVAEKCIDWYQYNLSASSVTDPKGTTTGSERVVKGAEWNCENRYCRSACRAYESPGSYRHEYGFRVVALPAAK